MKKHLLLFLSLFFFVTACSNASDEVLRAAHQAADKGAIILDVRTPAEFDTKHIKGAINIPLQVLNERYTELNKDKQIIVYCRSGNRSATAAKFLREQGWTVYDVATQGNWEKDVSAK